MNLFDSNGQPTAQLINNGVIASSSIPDDARNNSAVGLSTVVNVQPTKPIIDNKMPAAVADTSSALPLILVIFGIIIIYEFL
jgi:hypothetical protein